MRNKTYRTKFDQYFPKLCGSNLHQNHQEQCKANMKRSRKSKNWNEMSQKKKKPGTWGQSDHKPGRGSGGRTIFQKWYRSDKGGEIGWAVFSYRRRRSSRRYIRSRNRPRRRWGRRGSRSARWRSRSRQPCIGGGGDGGEGDREVWREWNWRERRVWERVVALLWFDVCVLLMNLS